MELVADTIAWFLDPAQWSGADAVPVRLFEHVQLSAASVLAALLVALPAGLAIGHTGRGGALAVSIANIGRALPSFALLVMVLPPTLALGLGLGFWPTFIALFLLAIPPILTNTYAGMRNVDREMVEAARGLGMGEGQIALRVELPISLPVILAGVRTASVQVIATATLGAIVAGGGLGRYLVDGFARDDDPRLVAGALLVALLAIATERAFELLERRAVSPGLQGRARDVPPGPGLAGVPAPSQSGAPSVG